MQGLPDRDRSISIVGLGSLLSVLWQVCPLDGCLADRVIVQGCRGATHVSRLSNKLGGI